MPTYPCCIRTSEKLRARENNKYIGFASHEYNVLCWDFLELSGNK